MAVVGAQCGNIFGFEHLRHHCNLRRVTHVRRNAAWDASAQARGT